VHLGEPRTKNRAAQMRLTVNVVNVVNVVERPQSVLQPSPVMTTEVQLQNEPNNPFAFNPQSSTARVAKA
jgi:hypothetical protein